MLFDIEVKISLKSGMLNPEATTIERSLDLLGYEVSNVKTVETIKFQMEGEDREVTDNGLEKAVLIYKKNTPEEKTIEIEIDGFFLAIGHTPNTTLFPNVATDEQGFIKVDGATSHTNIDGVFACGDVCDPRYRQAITAAASGCRAAKDAELWLIRNDAH